MGAAMVGVVSGVVRNLFLNVHQWSYVTFNPWLVYELLHDHQMHREQVNIYNLTPYLPHFSLKF